MQQFLWRTHLRSPLAKEANRPLVQRNTIIDYGEAIGRLSENERFKATIYAINTLLIQKGYYSPEEFRFQFQQSAEKQLRKRKQR